MEFWFSFFLFTKFDCKKKIKTRKVCIELKQLKINSAFTKDIPLKASIGGIKQYFSQLTIRTASTREFEERGIYVESVLNGEKKFGS